MKRGHKRRPNPAFRRSMKDIPEGHEFCFMCGESHPKPVFEVDEETGDGVHVMKESCVELRRMALGLAAQALINRLVK